MRSALSSALQSSAAIRSGRISAVRASASSRRILIGLGWLLFVLFLLLLALAATPAMAGERVSVTVEETVFVSEGGSERFVASMPAAVPQGIAQFGPFRVLDAGRAAFVGPTGLVRLPITACTIAWRVG